LARQLRLRLSASEDSDIPKNLQNIVVSIHAIATFQALHDYLRPRVAGVMSGGSRLSSMLAALAAHGYASGSSRASLEEAVAAAQQAMSAGSLSSAPPVPRSEPTESSSEAPKRRRSLRLSAKQGGSSASNEQQTGDVGTSASEANAPPNDSSAPAASSTVDAPVAQESISTAGAGDSLLQNHHDGFEEADFTDNEVDAEVSSCCDAFKLPSVSNKPCRSSRKKWIQILQSMTKQSASILKKVNSIRNLCNLSVSNILSRKLEGGRTNA
jgi:E3 ubiquitin-protein ligase TRIP12